MRSVSAIIPVRDQKPSLLAEAVESAAVIADEVVVVVDRNQDTSGVGGAVIVQSPGEGISAALNHGAAVASCSALAFLDSDDVWLPAKAYQLTDEGPSFTDYRRGGADVICDRPLQRMFSDNIICRSTTLVPAELFFAVGGFDVGLVWAQDWDFHCKVQRAAGWRRVPVIGSEIRDQAHGHTATAPQGLRSKHCATVRRRYR